MGTRKHREGGRGTANGLGRGRGRGVKGPGKKDESQLSLEGSMNGLSHGRWHTSGQGEIPLWPNYNAERREIIPFEMLLGIEVQNFRKF